MGKRKKAIHGVADLKEELEIARRQLEDAKHVVMKKQQNYNMVKFQDLKNKLQKLKQCNKMRLEKKIDYYVEEVTEEEIAEIVSRWTEIPVAKLVQGEREKLLNLKENFT